MNNISSDMLQKASVFLGYSMDGIKAYENMVEGEENQKKDKELIKEYGSKKAKKIETLSRINLLCDFLTLKTLKPEDEDTFIDELCKEAKNLYDLKGE